MSLSHGGLSLPQTHCRKDEPIKNIVVMGRALLISHHCQCFFY